MDTNFLKSNGIDVDKGIELLGDLDTYNSIMEDFSEIFNERMERIKNYKEKGDMPNYAIEVHSLKSDSKYLGFNALADIAYKHEMASKSGDVNTVNNTYNDLVNEASRIDGIVDKYLDGIDNDDESDNNSDNVADAATTNTSANTNVQTNTVSAPNKKVILIADDSSIIRDFVEDIFKGQYEVVGARTGREVADFISKNLDRVAVLLLDLNMPDINGFQVLEWFKQNDLFKKIPVSVITGASDKESVDRAFTYPICDMLNKPFERETVKDVVEKTLDFNNNKNEA